MEEAVTAAHKSWLDINLTKLQSTLDAQGLEIVENQKEGLQSRKRLAEQTKDFRKLADDEKLRELKNLLKAYQGEIDNITKRTKVAETAFLDLYKLLAEAPDPAPFIESYADQSQRLSEFRSIEQENKRLKAELAEAHGQLASARNSEGSIATLKSRLSKYEAKLEEMVNEKVAQKEAELKDTMDEKIRIYKETEHSLQRQLNQVKDQLVQLQSTHDTTQAQLVDHNQQYDEEVASKLGELEIVLVDLDRANLKIVQLERDNEILRKEMNESRGTNIDGEWQDRAEFAFKVDVTRLLAETDELKEQLKEKEATYGKRLSELERDVALKNLSVAELETKLAEFEDYDKIKEELNVIKSIELDWVPDSDTSDHSLERLMLEKNKRLQADVTSLKVDNLNLTDELETVNRQLNDLRQRNSQQQSLISQLEEDLSKVNNMLESGKEDVPRGPALDPLAALVADAKLSPPYAEPLAAAAARGTPATPGTPGVPGGGTGEASSSIIPILTSQRDRYRQKNTELEQLIRTHLSMISELRVEIDKLKSDNVALYEKLRYTQSFQEGSAAAARRGDAGQWRGGRERENDEHRVSMPPVFDQKRPADEDVANKYKSVYEGKLDPFRQFHKQEEARRVRNMNPAERATLNLTKMIVGNKYTRWFFLLYSMMLHMLVFATLYKLSQWEECRHAQRWLFQNTCTPGPCISNPSYASNCYQNSLAQPSQSSSPSTTASAAPATTSGTATGGATGTATVTGTSTPTSTSNPSSNNTSSSSSPNIGAIIGGIVAALIIIGALAAFVLIRRKKSNKQPSSMPSGKNAEEGASLRPNDTLNVVSVLEKKYIVQHAYEPAAEDEIRLQPGERVKLDLLFNDASHPTPYSPRHLDYEHEPAERGRSLDIKGGNERSKRSTSANPPSSSGSYQIEKQADKERVQNVERELNLGGAGSDLGGKNVGKEGLLAKVVSALSGNRWFGAAATPQIDPFHPPRTSSLEAPDSSGTQIFEVPLIAVVKKAGTNNIPNVVIACITYVEERGLDAEGLYRVPGSARRVKSWQETFDHDEFNGWRDENIATVASVLKKFFANLPSGGLFGPNSDGLKKRLNSIVTDHLFRQPATDPDQVKATRVHTALGTYLPTSAHYATIKCFMTHLHRVSLHAATNRMPPKNLALAIFPGMVDAGEFMISHAGEVFSVPEEVLKKPFEVDTKDLGGEAMGETIPTSSSSLPTSLPTPTPLPPHASFSHQHHASSLPSSTPHHLHANSQPIPLPPGPNPSHPYPYSHKPSPLSSTMPSLSPPPDTNKMGRSVTSETSETPSVVVTEDSMSDGVEVDYVVVGDDDVGGVGAEGMSVGAGEEVGKGTTSPIAHAAVGALVSPAKR
ncbi:hypothetical protein HDV00_003517 [Rhizophlyctis rosea]|nr:hypothetical protein HDV00_003517 [Rhizophlyctis rosea]